MVSGVSPGIGTGAGVRATASMVGVGEANGDDIHGVLKTILLVIGDQHKRTTETSDAYLAAPECFLLQDTYPTAQLTRHAEARRSVPSPHRTTRAKAASAVALANVDLTTDLTTVPARPPSRTAHPSRPPPPAAYAG